MILCHPGSVVFFITILRAKTIGLTSTWCFCIELVSNPCQSEIHDSLGIHISLPGSWCLHKRCRGGRCGGIRVPRWWRHDWRQWWAAPKVAGPAPPPPHSPQEPPPPPQTPARTHLRLQQIMLIQILFKNWLKNIDGLGHETVAVLLPGFAINW